MQQIIDALPAAKRFVSDCDPCTMGLTARWFEQLRTVRQQLQRWLPAVGGLPLWSFRSGDLMSTIDSLQRYLNDLSDTIIKLADPLAPLSAAAVEEMELKLSAVTEIAQRLESSLNSAAMAA